MDMDEILSVLYKAAVEDDPVCWEKARRAFQETQPYYDRLCQALGEEEGDRIWNAISSAVTAEREYTFRCGLRLGLRLMALCL